MNLYPDMTLIEIVILWLMRVGAAMTGTVAFSVLFRAPKRDWLGGGAAGSIGWIVYCILTDFGMGVVMPNFFATAALTIFSWWMAFRRRTPVTVYLVPGIFPLVPGAGIYYTAYYFVMSQSARGAAKAVETMEVAGAITVGIIMGQAIVSAWLRSTGKKRGIAPLK